MHIGPFRACTTLAIATSLAACSGTTSQDGAGGMADAADDSAQSADAGDADASDQAEASHAGDAFESDDAHEEYPEVPATLQVRFHVTNATGATRYLATAAQACVPWSIEALESGEWRPLALGLLNRNETCACTGGCDYIAGTTELIVLPSGDVFTLTWDGRAHKTWNADHTCPGNTDHWSTVEGALQPLPIGHYRVVVGVLTTLPSSCTAASDGKSASCEISKHVSPGGPMPRCEDASPVTAEFDITVEHELDVFVPLGDTAGCDPVGTWSVSYWCENQGPVSAEPDEVTMSAADGGVIVGSMTTHVPGFGTDVQESSSVQFDTAGCSVSAKSDSAWAAGAEGWYDKRQLSATLQGDTGFGSMTRMIMEGCCSPIEQKCAAMLVRKQLP